MATRSQALKKSAAEAAPEKPKTVRGASALDLDRLIHERTRLAIVSALAASGTMSFSELKKALGMTDGNLSVHSRKLEDAGYVLCTKGFAGRVPRTEYKLTAAGRKAFERYLAHMEALVQAAKKK